MFGIFQEISTYSAWPTILFSSQAPALAPFASECYIYLYVPKDHTCVAAFGYFNFHHCLFTISMVGGKNQVPSFPSTLSAPHPCIIITPQFELNQ